MKKQIISIIAMMLFITSYSQMETSQMTRMKIEPDSTVTYGVGNEMLGYKMYRKEVPKGFVSSHDRYPVLQYFVKIEEQFIGGRLINETSKDTAIIKNLHLVIDDADHGVFEIKADKFNFDLITLNGWILEETQDSILFAWIGNEKIEYYRIIKK